FAGFNLLLGDSKALYYANNIEGVISQLEPGIYGLSNGLLNDNQPRVERGEKKLKSLLDPDHKLDTDLLIRMMADKEAATDQELSSKPVTFKLERQLSSTFIVDQEQRYGTRCSTAVIRNEMGNVRFCEQNYDSSGKPTGCNFFELRAMPTK
ncbi:MAG: NRDE family protein, partial [Pseudomonadota bacterium]|nr:NRDE family protein [Pseudomonadota bacterium]